MLLLLPYTHLGFLLLAFELNLTFQVPNLIYKNYFLILKPLVVFDDASVLLLQIKKAETCPRSLSNNIISDIPVFLQNETIPTDQFTKYLYSLLQLIFFCSLDILN